MDYNESYLVMHFGFWVGFLMGIIGLSSKIKLIAYLGIILLLASLVQGFIFYKCPKCNKKLNIKSKKPKYCPECGYTLK